MIYLNAQPDRSYFIWQLLVQQHNFKRLGIDPKSVFVLVGYIETPNQKWNDYQWDFNVLFYKDERETTAYKPSLRPHLIKKFIEDKPELVTNGVFYYDADIIFREPLNFELLKDKVYFSEAYYVGYNYVAEKSKRVLYDLAKVVGVDVAELKIHNSKAGGAQYYFPTITYDFWNEVEILCEKMHSTYKANEASYAQEWQLDHTDKWDFQIWPVDMFVINWMLIRDKIDYDISKELDFSWPTNGLNSDKGWNNYKIFHNSGVTKQVANDLKLLHKQDYEHHFPDDIKLSDYNGEYNQINYLKEIVATFQIAQPQVQVIEPFINKRFTFIYVFKGDFKEVNEAVKKFNYQNKKDQVTFLVINNTEFDLKLLNARVINQNEIPFEYIKQTLSIEGTMIEWTNSNKGPDFLDLYV